MKAFFDSIRPLWPGGKLPQQAVDWINAVVAELAKRDMPVTHKAYILGTAHHESDHWKTMVEYASGKAYEGRADLGNTVKGDGVRFKGRGLVQITGRRNYTDWAKRLGVPLVDRPELAAQLHYAVRILIDGMVIGTFTGRKLSDFATYEDMRRVVNGTDRASVIAGYARVYEKALRALPEPTVVPAPEPRASETPVSQTRPVEHVNAPDPQKSGAVVKALVALITALVGIGVFTLDQIKAALGF
jgi:hypothetical protein